MLVYGADKPQRRPPPLLVGGLVGLAAGLAIGLVVAERTGDRGHAPGPTSGASPEAGESAPAAEPSVPAVAAGAITKLGPHADSIFLLAVYNEGEEEVTATLAALPGWMPPLTGVIPTAVRPHSWDHVMFEARPDCGIHPGTVRSVRLQVRNGDVLADRIALLPQAAQALREHHDAVCGD